MANIKLIKFVSGEEIVADVIATNEQGLVISDAVTLVYRPQEGGQMTIGFAPFMPYSEGTLTLYHLAILAITEPQEDLRKEFNRIFAPANDSGIIVPPKELILPQ